MPLLEFPVAIPYRLLDDRDGVHFLVQVRAIASGEPAAIATAQVLVKALASLHHRGKAVEVLIERTKVGAPGGQVDGPYVYVLTHGNHIHHLAFPPRIDSQSGEVMGNAFAGLDPKTLHGVVMDCHPLVYINTAGLASIAAHAKRLHLRLFRVSDPVRRVFEIVGLMQLLHVHSTLQSALDHLVNELAPQAHTHPA
jgi:anti-anti-sigma regulatory factor